MTDGLIRELQVETTPRLEVFNKCDLSGTELFPRQEDAVCVSAVTGEGLEELRTRILSLLRGREQEITFLLPYSRAGELDALHSGGKVTKTEYTQEGILVRAVCRPETYGRLRAYVQHEE